MLPTLLGVMLLLFSLTYFLPGDPVSILLGPRATPDLVVLIKERLRLNDPIHVRLGYYLLGVLKGDLGTSVWSGYQVRSLIAKELPHTIVLTFTSLGVAALFSIFIGVFAAMRQENRKGFTVTIVSLLSVAAPDFVWALLLVLFFCIKLPLFPALGAGVKGDLIDMAVHLILPATALAIPWFGYLSRLTQESMNEVLGSDYIRTARAFAIPKRIIAYRYALKNGIIPTITVLGMGVGKLLGGAVFVEIIFNRPGMGKLIVDAVYQRDLPVVQGAILVTALMFVLANLLADISYAFLDPRIQYD